MTKTQNRITKTLIKVKMKTENKNELNIIIVSQ